MTEKEKLTQPIDLDSDPDWTLAEWLLFVTELISKYGNEVNLRTDAGYNNVSLILEDKRK